MMTAYDRLTEILICDMDADPAAIQPQSALADLVETGDDREMLWMMKYISDRFQRSISVQQIRSATTVQSLADLIDAL